jgi:hypothetical protein
LQNFILNKQETYNIYLKQGHNLIILRKEKTEITYIQKCSLVYIPEQIKNGIIFLIITILEANNKSIVCEVGKGRGYEVLFQNWYEVVL